MFPSGLKGIINSPSKFPLSNIFFICLLIILGINNALIFVKSLISFWTNAISALSNKKSEVINDLNGKNKFSFDKIISFFFIKIFGFFNLTARFNSLRLRCIFVS